MVYGVQKRSHAGSILIVSLWLLALFVLLVLSLGYRSHLEATLSGREQEVFITEQSLFSGINLARYYLINDEDTSVDSQFDRWYNQVELDEDVWSSGNLSLSIVDEERKLAINVANERQLVTLFETIEDEGATISIPIEDLVSAILEWRGDSAAQGRASPGYDYKGASFESLYELLLLPDMMYDDFNVIKEYLTVHTAHTDLVMVNPNTVSAAVVKSIIYSLAGGERYKKKMYEQIVEFRSLQSDIDAETLDESEEEDTFYFTEDDLSPYNFLNKVDILPDVNSVALAIQLVRHFTVDSQIFSISMAVNLPDAPAFRRVEAVIGPSATGSGTESTSDTVAILAWHEF